jgi:hypothetical protein
MQSTALVAEIMRMQGAARQNLRAVRPRTRKTRFTYRKRVQKKQITTGKTPKRRGCIEGFLNDMILKQGSNIHGFRFKVQTYAYYL